MSTAFRLPTTLHASSRRHTTARMMKSPLNSMRLSNFARGVESLATSQNRSISARKNVLRVEARASQDLDANGNPRLPTLFERVLASLIYIIPALDSTAITLSLFKWWASLSWTWFILEPISGFYYSSSFTPLVIFFVVFLAVVRNKKFHHLVRYHAMQAVMIDIVIMLANIIRMSLPPEIRWSMMMIVVDRFLGATVVAALCFCLWHAIQGQYADIPYVSEAVYIQVDMLESYGG